MRLKGQLHCAGDSHGLHQAAQPSNTHLPLKYRPADGMCRPIFGEKCSVKGLLVAVTRPEQGAMALKVEAVARVNGSYQFSSLADFQYTADDSLAIQASSWQVLHISDVSATLVNPPAGLYFDCMRQRLLRDNAAARRVFNATGSGASLDSAAHFCQA